MPRCLYRKTKLLYAINALLFAIYDCLVSSELYPRNAILPCAKRHNNAALPTATTEHRTLMLHVAPLFDAAVEPADAFMLAIVPNFGPAVENWRPSGLINRLIDCFKPPAGGAATFVAICSRSSVPRHKKSSSLTIAPIESKMMCASCTTSSFSASVSSDSSFAYRVLKSSLISSQIGRASCRERVF